MNEHKRKEEPLKMLWSRPSIITQSRRQSSLATVNGTARSSRVYNIRSHVLTADKICVSSCRKFEPCLVEQEVRSSGAATGFQEDLSGAM
ncbi:hypothetical protein M430DRAFT_69853 [Amorphotheca resinae ATCC 22711]|uniref:Uncharacterized protein n=1 Tax=Amorphotheca resinae ATCC 22711 TaxID=857342 RepID=A0A2T3AQQ1_AMORE|nr:hypothetical protein M430DRAFT_69853 [Amorphotheca resinae ATCC 22711]PSS08587.1 hypothetical protein M430DRAFT_69853 [Amorphotheca resinae ATCC 22711]